LKYDLAAVAATPDGYPNLAHHQQSLAVSYTDQFERLGNLDALESALKYNLAAVAATPDDHPDLAFRQQSLSTSYIHRFQKLGDLNDLDSALEYGIKAVATTPDGHPDLAVRQHSLATCNRFLGNVAQYLDHNSQCTQPMYIAKGCRSSGK